MVVDAFNKTGNGAVALVAFGLGTAFGLGFALAWISETLWTFGVYLMLISTFHLTEFLFVALYHPLDLSYESFLITHSEEYTIAIVASITEFFVEWYLIPCMKGVSIITYIGLIISFGGLCTRLLALWTAKHNFTHLIAEEKKEEHELVTTGIYSICRHPGYLGWFWYVIGTQIIMLNPICICGFGYTSWRFFQTRIKHEEEGLIRFFGEKYEDYRRKTPTLIPLIP